VVSGVARTYPKKKTFNLKLFSQVLAKPTNSHFEKVHECHDFFESSFIIANILNTRFWEDTYLGDKPILVVFYLI
jgi:hypothetical protein